MRHVFILFASVLLLSSCHIFGGKKVKGNGKTATQEREVGPFTKIEAGGAVSLHLKQDSATSVRIETDENLMEYLDIKVDGNTLVVETRSGYNLDPTKEVAVYIAAPTFEEIDLAGASHVYGEGTISGEKLQVGASGASQIQMDVRTVKFESELSGASTLRLKGNAENFSVDASGASKILCLDLNTSKAELDLSGASTAEVTAEKELKVDASGASNVRYRGTANINQKSSGASSVEKIN